MQKATAFILVSVLLALPASASARYLSVLTIEEILQEDGRSTANRNIMDTNPCGHVPHGLLRNQCLSNLRRGNTPSVSRTERRSLKTARYGSTDARARRALQQSANVRNRSLFIPRFVVPKYYRPNESAADIIKSIETERVDLTPGQQRRPQFAPELNTNVKMQTRGYLRSAAEAGTRWTAGNSARRATRRFCRGTAHRQARYEAAGVNCRVLEGN